MRLKSGLGKRLDVVQAEAQAAATRVFLINAQNDVINGRVLLSYLIGVDVNGSPLNDSAQVPAEIPALGELEQTALRNRQDLAAAIAAIEVAKYGVNAAISQYFPSVTFNVNYYLSRESIPTDSEWNMLLTANLPIFTGGAIEANVRSAWSLLRQAKLLESQARRGVQRDVTLAHQNLLVSRDRLRGLEVQVRAAQESYTEAKRLELGGVGTSLNALIAQDQLLVAQLQFTSERFDQKVFYLNLLRAMGILTTRLPGEAEPTTRPTTQPTTQPSAKMG